MRIMYVEDNQVNLGLVVRIAKMGDHEVVNFPNGTDALKALETEKIDLILMDIELEGEIDGIEVVKQLRARGDKRPVVAITAYAMVGDKERILEAGCDDYLPKPLPVAQFLNILSKYDPANDGKARGEAPAVRIPAADESKPKAKKPVAKSSLDAKPAAEPVQETKAAVEPVKSSKEATKPEAEKSAEEEAATEKKASVSSKGKAAEKKEQKAQVEKKATEEKPKEPERDPEATIPFDPEALEAEIKADREAKYNQTEQDDSVNKQSAELQAERESHDKPDKI